MLNFDEKKTTIYEGSVSIINFHLGGFFFILGWYSRIFIEKDLQSWDDPDEFLLAMSNIIHISVMGFGTLLVLTGFYTIIFWKYFHFSYKDNMLIYGKSIRSYLRITERKIELDNISKIKIIYYTKMYSTVDGEGTNIGGKIVLENQTENQNGLEIYQGSKESSKRLGYKLNNVLGIKFEIEDRID
ncbi:MAG: hypothetical protein ACXAD7_24830 [Candidatus Kariarchaeaceae archaeon]|jgi:hypothetical protein